MKKAAKRFLKSEFFFHYKKNLPAIIGTVLIGIAIFVALFGRQLLAIQNPYDLTQIDLSNSYLPPAWLEGGAGSFLWERIIREDVFSARLFTEASVLLLLVFAECPLPALSGLLWGCWPAILEELWTALSCVSQTFSCLSLLCLSLCLFCPS